MLLVTLMITTIFYISYYLLINEFWGFVKLLQIISANNFSANIKLSKTQLHRIGQLGGFLGRLLGPLLKAGLP